MVSIVFANKKKKKKKSAIGTKRKSDYYNTKPKQPYRDNPLSFKKNEIEGSFGIASLATSAGHPCYRKVLQTCSYSLLFP